MEEKRGKSKLLLIAIIVALVLWVGFMTAVVLHDILIISKGYTADDIRLILINFGVVLLVLAIPTLLIVFGERKNKRKMILAAGIVYIFTVVGIPSAVMCFIVFARMKKQEAT